MSMSTSVPRSVTTVRLPVADDLSVPYTRTEICAEAREAARVVLESGWVTSGPQTQLFEGEFAGLVGARHAVAVSSGTAALELVLRDLRLPPGGLVLVPDLTFCGAAQAVLHAGLRPLLVDVEPATGMPTAATVRRAVRAFGRPEALMALHYAGAPAPLRELGEAAGLPPHRVVEDAAHALGTFLGGRPVGALSRAACFSFAAGATLPIGEGGMITTEDDDLAAGCRRARLHGMSTDDWRRHQPGGAWQYAVEEPGLKANLTDLQAAIGRAQLRHLAGWQRRRAVLAARYTARLSGVPGLTTPRPPTAGLHSWQLYVLRVGPEYPLRRNRLVARLAEHGIGSSVHFIPLHRLGYLRRAALRPPEGLPGADALFPELLSLPLHPGLTESQVDRVCAVIAEAEADPGPGVRP
ncbi:hypothetical protein CFP65_5949 [Kitasatospora sp. MMS16-BH015]|uniref:DegT/DnrJ/EryC1/StrS family aminotransferase n=1 Tax=Kitasatospora sp. MMS16-BH015 TaxID=2018025 RepID=UPI000CA33B44|nr:DegT/DnrJ/EryC1/StrS family aminotransferase [Kitasatospora sp. MMS16-BH015]AUG80624.1 hypothetical protein CFP65_5949 [Kitasatospora sp. MMS16-BH015]